MSGDVMMFPDTVEEFMEQNKLVDSEQVYSNGIEFVPIFRMQQWFDHVKHSPDDVRGVVHCKDCKWSHAGYCEKYDDLIPWGCANKPWEDWFCADGKRREIIKEDQDAD